MMLLETFLKKSKNKRIKIGIGVGTSQKQYRTIINGIIKYLTYNQAEISLFGYQFDEQETLNEEINTKSRFTIKFIASENPEKEIIKYLKNHKLDAAIRGGLSSNEFLTTIKSVYNIHQINRLALLETIEGHQFFFGPVGIDECNDIDAKISFLKQSLELFEVMQLKPVISILSGGRKGDIGRSSSVDQTIKDAEEIVKQFKQNLPELKITHNEILIEKAITNKSNLILAPNGISGNLIYRTLVHLGGGKAYGAIYLGIESIIIDTSRVGKASEIEGALILANALHS